MSPNVRGSVFMTASMASYVMNDALMKTLAADMSLFQALFLRGIGSTVLLIAAAAAMGMLNLHLPRRDRKMVLVRTAAEAGASYFFVTALFHMPIANATAIMQALPLTVTLAGAAVLGEAVGWRRLSAILVGFVGVMLIVRPGAAGFTVYSVYVMAAVVCITVRDLASRLVSIETPTLTVAVAASAGVLAFAGAGLIGESWQPVPLRGWLALAGASVFIVGGFLFAILTMRVGEIAFIAPFRYTSLLWALVIGFVFFGDWPDLMTLFGAAIVVATGIFTFHRERQLANLRAAAGPASVDTPGDSI